MTDSKGQEEKVHEKGNKEKKSLPKKIEIIERPFNLSFMKFVANHATIDIIAKGLEGCVDLLINFGFLAKNIRPSPVDKKPQFFDGKDWVNLRGRGVLDRKFFPVMLVFAEALMIRDGHKLNATDKENAEKCVLKLKVIAEVHWAKLEKEEIEKAKGAETK